MAWNFQFQGVREDAIAAVANITSDLGPGHQDQLNRAAALITQELQAMQPGTVLVSCYGKYHGSLPRYNSEIVITVQNIPVINKGVGSLPDSGTK